jgi:hypothetical protein
MFTEDAFDQIITKLNGMPIEEAGRIAALIGDPSEVDDNGYVMLDGKIILLEE